MKTFWLFAVALAPSLCFASVDTCSTAGLTQDCSMFRNLKPTDDLTLPSGTKIPACLLSSVHSEYEDREKRRSQEALAKFNVALEKVPDSLLGPKFKEFILKEDARPLAISTELGDGLFSYPWPPESSSTDTGEKSLGTKEFYIEARRRFERAGQGEELEKLVALARDSVEHRREFLEASGFKRSAELPAGQKVRLKRSFDQSKAGVLEYLDNTGMTDRQRTQLKDRADSIALKDSADEIESTAWDCMGYRSFAANDLDMHQVILPDWLKAFPDGAQIRSSAHEIAHSFDICRSQQDLVTFKNDKARTDSFNRPMEPRKLGFPGDQDKPESYKIASAAFSPTSSPFESIWRCLASETGGSFGSKYMKAEPSTPLSKDDACDEGHSCEAFSDWIAAEVIGDRLLELPVAAQKAQAMDYLVFSLDQACSDKIGGLSDVNFSHPSWDRRTDSLLLKNEKIRKALGCEAINQPCKMPEAQNQSGQAIAKPGVSRKSKLPGKKH